MTAQAHSCVRSFPNGDSIAAGRGVRVRLNSGNLAACTAAQEEIGVLEETLLAGDPLGSVRFVSESESIYCVADGAITAGVDVYRDANGEVTSTQAGTEDRFGIALEAAAADQDLIEILPKRLQSLT